MIDFCLMLVKLQQIFDLHFWFTRSDDDPLLASVSDTFTSVSYVIQNHFLYQSKI
jgi:hypothetical protein